MDLKPQNLLLSITANRKYVLKVGGIDKFLFMCTCISCQLPVKLCSSLHKCSCLVLL